MAPEATAIVYNLQLAIPPSFIRVRTKSLTLFVIRYIEFLSFLRPRDILITWYGNENPFVSYMYERNHFTVKCL